MKILITGSEGNIGSRLVPYLIDKGHLVYRCDIIQATGDYYSVTDINSGTKVRSVPEFISVTE